MNLEDFNNKILIINDYAKNTLLKKINKFTFIINKNILVEKNKKICYNSKSIKNRKIHKNNFLGGKL